MSNHYLLFRYLCGYTHILKCIHIFVQIQQETPIDDLNFMVSEIGLDVIGCAHLKNCVESVNGDLFSWFDMYGKCS